MPLSHKLASERAGTRKYIWQLTRVAFGVRAFDAQRLHTATIRGQSFPDMRNKARNSMAVEIERKFLVVGDGWRSTECVRILQGYLARSNQFSVRIRLSGQHGVLSVKGGLAGITRKEFQYDIPIEDARQILALSDFPIVEKVRTRVNFEGTCWEVDEFCGDNAGLVIAEVELNQEDAAFAKPTWIGTEVTHDMRYYNSNLAVCPFTSWGKMSTRDELREMLEVARHRDAKDGSLK